MSAKETTERQRLLERWAVLESERCQSITDGAFWLHRNGAAFAIAASKSADEDRILCALIEAITARGWNYAIESDIPRVTASVFANDPNYAIAHADQPAGALLSAYLQAIEAKENS